MGYSPWDHKELDTAEQLSFTFLRDKPCDIYLFIYYTIKYIYKKKYEVLIFITTPVLHVYFAKHFILWYVSLIPCWFLLYNSDLIFPYISK